MFSELVLDSCSGLPRKCFPRLPTCVEVEGGGLVVRRTKRKPVSKGVAGGAGDP